MVEKKSRIDPTNKVREFWLKTRPLPFVQTKWMPKSSEPVVPWKAIVSNRGQLICKRKARNLFQTKQ